MSETEKFISIPVVIPAYEPDERMTNLLEDLQREGIFPIVIVNDGSSHDYDELFETAEKKFGAVVLRHSKNIGKGAALKTAFSYCLEKFSGIIGCVTADCDGQHSVRDIGMIRSELALLSGTLILGVRDFDSENDLIPAKSRFGNNLTKKVFKKLYKLYISDTQTGLRGIPSSFMKDLIYTD